MVDKICVSCGTVRKCRHNPEHKSLCFVPTCDCGEFKEEIADKTGQDSRGKK